ncbi:hypothetical protein Tco_0385546, partial [Tanacetum coccineum]
MVPEVDPDMQGKGYRVGVEWGKVRDSCRGTWEVVWELKLWERGWFEVGGKRGG